MVRPLVILLLLVHSVAAQPSTTTPTAASEHTEVALALHGGAIALAAACDDCGNKTAWGPFVEAAITKRFAWASVGLYASAGYFRRFPHLEDDELTYRYSHAEAVHTGGRIALGGADHGFDVGVGLGLLGVTDADPRTQGGVVPTFELFANVVVDRFGSFGSSLFGVVDVTPTGDGAVASLRVGFGFESY